LHSSFYILLCRPTFVYATYGADIPEERSHAEPAALYTAAVSEVRYTCVAAASFGLESVVRVELETLGVQGARAADRRVFFEGSARDIARCNLGLRTADRVLIQLSEFPAADFDALYEGVRAVPWRDLLSASAAVDVAARSVKSRLTATPSVQSVAKKAIVDAMRGTRGRARPSARMEETGPHYDVEVALQSDRASVCLDTTGPGLHKRGYRVAAGEAPLRENLAAALVLLSRWEGSRPFADPFCGSGTIPIEAALVAANIAPGIGRTFAAEAWSLISSTVWTEAREQARAEERRQARIGIAGSDRDGRIVKVAEENARAAGVAQLIRFRQAPFEAFAPEGDYGCMVCNPPYGLRLGEQKEVEMLHRAMGTLFRSLPTWSLFAISASEDFQKFFGARASRNRKLYNGNVRCWYYQYFGPLQGRGKVAVG
jgi:putative N6-adenine-specific DNA methylase